MAMLRLLARDTGAVTVLPEVVVKDELQQGRLRGYERLPNLFENFFAITLPREFMPSLVSELLSRSIQDLA